MKAALAALLLACAVCWADGWEGDVEDDVRTAEVLLELGLESEEFSVDVLGSPEGGFVVSVLLERPYGGMSDEATALALCFGTAAAVEDISGLRYVQCSVAYSDAVLFATMPTCERLLAMRTATAEEIVEYMDGHVGAFFREAEE